MVQGRRKNRIGRVVSRKMDKTVVVAVNWYQRHILYKKPMRRITKFYVDDREGLCQLGDTILIVETRPLSKTKRWRVAEILSHREVADIQPREIVSASITNVGDDEATSRPSDEASSRTDITQEIPAAEQPSEKPKTSKKTSPPQELPAAEQPSEKPKTSKKSNPPQELPAAEQPSEKPKTSKKTSPPQEIPAAEQPSEESREQGDQK